MFRDMQQTNKPIHQNKNHSHINLIENNSFTCNRKCMSWKPWQLHQFLAAPMVFAPIP